MRIARRTDKQSRLAIRSGGPELLVATAQHQRLYPVPMEGTRRRRTRKAIWDPTEDTRPQWREALTTHVLYREVCGLAARENGLHIQTIMF